MDKRKENLLSIIDKSLYGVLSVNSKNEPYARAYSFARDGNYLYFHTIKSNKKRELLDNKNCIINFVESANVSNKYSLDEIEKIHREGNICKITGDIFTMKYRAGIVKGKIELLTEVEDKKEALILISEKYTKDKMEYFSDAFNKSGKAADIYKIYIKEYQGKVR